MLFHLFNSARAVWPFQNVVQYITFRTAVASISAFAISLLMGPWLIRRLRQFQIGQIVRTDGPASHSKKSGTPTMGGLLILAAAFVPTLLWANLTNPDVWIAICATAGFGAIGFADDYLKITRKNTHGLFARYKMAAQLVVQLAAERGGAGAAEVDAVAADRLDETLFQRRAVVEEDAVQLLARPVDRLQMLQRHAEHGFRHRARVAGVTLAVHLAVAGKKEGAVDEDGGAIH